MTHLVLSQGALLSLIGVYDPFQQRERMGCIYARAQDVRFDIPDSWQDPPSWGYFGVHRAEFLHNDFVYMTFVMTFNN